MTTTAAIIWSASKDRRGAPPSGEKTLRWISIIEVNWSDSTYWIDEKVTDFENYDEWYNNDPNQ